MNNYCFKSILCLLCFSISPIAKAQLSPEQKKEILSDIGKVLEKRYVFPETAEAMNTGIMEHFKLGNYDTITHGNEFALRLSKNLREISKDLHLSVSYSENEIYLPMTVRLQWSR